VHNLFISPPGKVIFHPIFHPSIVVVSFSDLSLPHNDLLHLGCLGFLASATFDRTHTSARNTLLLRVPFLLDVAFDAGHGHTRR
jgi:hypothetical protein